jgi:hypothetical protein
MKRKREEAFVSKSALKEDASALKDVKLELRSDQKMSALKEDLKDAQKDEDDEETGRSLFLSSTPTAQWFPLPQFNPCAYNFPFPLNTKPHEQLQLLFQLPVSDWHPQWIEKVLTADPDQLLWLRLDMAFALPHVAFTFDQLNSAQKLDHGYWNMPLSTDDEDESRLIESSKQFKNSGFHHCFLPPLGWVIYYLFKRALLRRNQEHHRPSCGWSCASVFREESHIVFGSPDALHAPFWPESVYIFKTPIDRRRGFAYTSAAAGWIDGQCKLNLPNAEYMCHEVLYEYPTVVQDLVISVSDHNGLPHWFPIVQFGGHPNILMLIAEFLFETQAVPTLPILVQNQLERIYSLLFTYTVQQSKHRMQLYQFLDECLCNNKQGTQPIPTCQVTQPIPNAYHVFCYLGF